MGAIAVSLALYNRDRNGLGDVLEVPLTAGLMDGLVYNSLDVQVSCLYSATEFVFLNPGEK